MNTAWKPPSSGRAASVWLARNDKYNPCERSLERKSPLQKARLSSAGNGMPERVDFGLLVETGNNLGKTHIFAPG